MLSKLFQIVKRRLNPNTLAIGVACSTIHDDGLREQAFYLCNKVAKEGYNFQKAVDIMLLIKAIDSVGTLSLQNVEKFVFDHIITLDVGGRGFACMPRNNPDFVLAYFPWGFVVIDQFGDVNTQFGLQKVPQNQPFWRRVNRINPKTGNLIYRNGLYFEVEYNSGKAVVKEYSLGNHGLRAAISADNTEKFKLLKDLTGFEVFLSQDGAYLDVFYDKVRGLAYGFEDIAYHVPVNCSDQEWLYRLAHFLKSNLPDRDWQELLPVDKYVKDTLWSYGSC